jgi:trk system potassium uptake protein TrkA
MKSIAVVGLGQFGYQLAIGLTQKGFEVVAIDQEEEPVDEIKDLVSQSIILDSTDEKSMRSINIDYVDIAIVAIGSNVQSSLLTTALLQRMGIQDIYVRSISVLQESILKSMEIKNIIGIEKEMGIQVANTLASQGVGRYVAISDRHSVMEVHVPLHMVTKTLKELNLRSQYRVMVVGIKSRIATVKDDGEISYNIQMTDLPDQNYPLGSDDLLIISGADDYLKKFIRLGESND